MSTIKAEKLQSLGSKLNFLTGATPTQRLTIDENGNVGIGTAAPAVALDVVGAISTSGNLKLTGGSSTSLSVAYTSNDSNRALLGWNTLQLGNNGQNRIVAGNTNVSGYLEFWVNNTTDLITNSTASNGIQAMTIASTGKVGIGVAAPLVALDIEGEARSSTSTTSASNAKTLTTKDYVEDLNRLGSVICCLITYADSSASTHLSQYGITKTANTFAFTLPTGNWTGYIFVMSGVTPVSTQTNGIALQVPATSASRTLTTYSNTTGQLSGTADNSTPTNSTISCWQTATEAIVINLVRTG